MLDKEKVVIQNISTDYTDIINKILGKSKTTLFFVVVCMFLLSYYFGRSVEHDIWGRPINLNILNIVWYYIFNVNKFNLPIAVVFSSFCILIARIIYSIGLSNFIASLFEWCHLKLKGYFAKPYIELYSYTEILEIKKRKYINAQTLELLKKHKKPILILLEQIQNNIDNYKDNGYNSERHSVKEEIKQKLDNTYPEFAQVVDKDVLRTDLNNIINKHYDKIGLNAYYFFNSDTIFFYIQKQNGKFIEIHKGKDKEISEIIGILRELDLMGYPNIELKDFNNYKEEIKFLGEKVIKNIEENNITTYNHTIMLQPNYLIKSIKTIKNILEQ